MCINLVAKKKEGKKKNRKKQKERYQLFPIWQRDTTQPDTVQKHAGDITPVYSRSFSPPQLYFFQETARLCGWNHAGFQNAAFQEKRKTEMCCLHILRKTFIVIVSRFVFLSWGREVFRVKKSAEPPNPPLRCSCLSEFLHKQDDRKAGIQSGHLCSTSIKWHHANSHKWPDKKKKKTTGGLAENVEDFLKIQGDAFIKFRC